MRPASLAPRFGTRRIGLLTVSVVLAFGYGVEPGDTLSELAQRFGTSTAALSQSNGLDDPDRLVAGTTLRVPDGDGEAAADESGTPAPDARGDVGALLERTAVEHGWSPAFVKALAWQESGWRQHHVSSAGAVGIMQVLPGTGQFVSTNLAGRPLDLDDPADNVLAGVLFLDYLYDLTDGDAERTLAGYYQGLASVRANGRYDDTERYIANVLALRERFR